MPSNVAFLARGQAKEKATEHLTPCHTTNHRTVAEGKNINIFSKTTGTYLLTLWVETTKR